MKRRVFNETDEPITIKPGEPIDLDIEKERTKIMSSSLIELKIQGEWGESE